MSNLFRLFMAIGLVAAAVVVIALGLARNTHSLMAPFNLLVFLVLVTLYFIPTALALYRNCAATAWIAALNILLGWTLFGWAIALGWATAGKQSSTHPASPPTTPSGPALQGR